VPTIQPPRPGLEFIFAQGLMRDARLMPWAEVNAATDRFGFAQRDVGALALTCKTLAHALHEPQHLQIQRLVHKGRALSPNVGPLTQAAHDRAIAYLEQTFAQSTLRPRDIGLMLPKIAPLHRFDPCAATEAEARRSSLILCMLLEIDAGFTDAQACGRAVDALRRTAPGPIKTFIQGIKMGIVKTLGAVAVLTGLCVGLTATLAHPPFWAEVGDLIVGEMPRASLESLFVVPLALIAAIASIYLSAFYMMVGVCVEFFELAKRIKGGWHHHEVFQDALILHRLHTGDLCEPALDTNGLFAWPKTPVYRLDVQTCFDRGLAVVGGLARRAADMTTHLLAHASALGTYAGSLRRRGLGRPAQAPLAPRPIRIPDLSL
jgi:hypothetical protein